MIEVWKEILVDAYTLATRSPDPSTQNAAIIVDRNGTICGSGVNEFPRGVKYLPERWERPLKYKIIEHAERNAIYEAARTTGEIEGTTMICPWAACSDCARAIIQSGIERLVTHKQAHDRSSEFWQKEIDIAFTMLKEAGVEIVMVDADNLGAPELLHSGQKWKP